MSGSSWNLSVSPWIWKKKQWLRMSPDGKTKIKEREMGDFHLLTHRICMVNVGKYPYMDGMGYNLGIFGLFTHWSSLFRTSFCTHFQINTLPVSKRIQPVDPWKIVVGLCPKRKHSSSNHLFSRANWPLVSGRVYALQHWESSLKQKRVRVFFRIYIRSTPQPRIPVTNEDLVRDSRT